MTEPIIAKREVTRHILASFGIRTQKKLGQHFLVDEAVVGSIAAALELQPGMRVLEIGPGTGGGEEWRYDRRAIEKRETRERKRESCLGGSDHREQ